MGEMSTSLILWGVVFASLGTGYFIYGKKQEDWIALIVGLVLCVIPYFIPNVWLLLLAGTALAAAPFIARRWL
jgi:hypothetical protein